MKKFFFLPRPTNCSHILLFVFLALGAISCNSLEPSKDDTGEKYPIRISADVLNSVKATDTSFEDGDKIGLTVVKWNGANTPDLTGDRVEDNASFSYQEGVFLPDAAAYFPDSFSKTEFFAYYPYNYAGFNRDANTLNVETGHKQNTAARYASYDYMCATAHAVTPTSGNVPMAFRHIMSKITVTLIAGEGYTATDIANATVELRRFHTKSVYNVSTGTFSELSDLRNIEMYCHSSSASAIVPPQQIMKGENLFYITIGDDVFAYKTDKAYDFESGKINEFTAVINKTVTKTKVCNMKVYEWN